MAMVNLTTNIEIALSIPRITKWEVLDAVDRWKDVDSNGSPLPHLDVTIRCCGSGAGDANPYCDKVIQICDSIASGTLAVNPAPKSYTDQIIVVQQSVSGNPYTTLAAVFSANTSGTGTMAKRIAALQEAIRAGAGTASGVVSAAFAGT